MRLSVLKIILLLILISPQFCRGNSLYDARIPDPDRPVAGISFTVHRPAADRWFAPDKFDHFLGSAMLSCCGTLALKVNHNDPDDAALGAVSATIGLGILKELYDMTSLAHHPSWKDLAVDIAGSVLGMLVAKSM